MKVTVYGSGYVGLVTGTCLAEVGNDVLCVDIDERKTAMLKNGEIPIYEPGLEALVTKNIEAGRLSFTTSPAEGVAHGLFQFIAVGTPPDEDGSADLQYVLAVANSIGEHMDEYRVIIDKSTVPVGTADKVRDKVNAVLKARGVDVEFDVVSNPEFLKEGAAIDDFMKPDRIVIGTDNPRTTELLRALYAPFNRSHDRMVAMDIRSAELTKYAANAMLATKISFMNELSNLAERLGADIEQVRVGSQRLAPQGQVADPGRAGGGKPVIDKGAEVNGRHKQHELHYPEHQERHGNILSENPNHYRVTSFCLLGLGRRLACLGSKAQISVFRQPDAPKAIVKAFPGLCQYTTFGAPNLV